MIYNYLWYEIMAHVKFSILQLGRLWLSLAFLFLHVWLSHGEMGLFLSHSSVATEKSQLRLVFWKWSVFHVEHLGLAVSIHTTTGWEMPGFIFLFSYLLQATSFARGEMLIHAGCHGDVHLNFILTAFRSYLPWNVYDQLLQLWPFSTSHSRRPQHTPPRDIM